MHQGKFLLRTGKNYAGHCRIFFQGIQLRKKSLEH